jgi:hypothetical protein
MINELLDVASEPLETAAELDRDKVLKKRDRLQTREAGNHSFLPRWTETDWGTVPTIGSVGGLEAAGAGG